jgi:phosphate transport system substrate-binding protein
VNRTMRNSLATAVVAGAGFALPALALGAATGSGASFPATAYTKWCQESGLCSYASKGSTGGINDLINGVVDFAASDAPLTPQQTADLASKRGGVKPLYFPTLIGPITVDTNISGISKGINFDGTTLADIFRGAITNWSDSRIRRPNPGVRFPNAPITLCVRSDGSGTSFNFTSYLSKVNPKFRTSVGASQQPNWPTTGIVKGARNPGVAACVESNANSVGYVDIADARDAGLTPFFARIGKKETVKKHGKRVRVTKYILPSPGSASKAGNLKTLKPDLTVSLTASPAPGAYPITTTTWILAYSNYAAAGKSSGSRDAVKKVLQYVYSPTAQNGLASLRFSKLPTPLLNAGKGQIAKIK